MPEVCEVALDLFDGGAISEFFHKNVEVGVLYVEIGHSIKFFADFSGHLKAEIIEGSLHQKIFS
jgi:hypothetical protein